MYIARHGARRGWHWIARASPESATLEGGTDGPAMKARSCRHVVRVTIAIADGLDAENRYEESLELFKEALALAEEGGHADAITNCWFRLGNGYERLGQAQTAIEASLLRLCSRDVRSGFPR